MEIYTLDQNNKISHVIEKIESLIWTERYSAYGEFELVLKSTPANRLRYQPEVRVIQSLSDRVMVIKTVEDTYDEEGRAVLIIKGYSLESLLLDKVARSGATTHPYRWVFDRKPAVGARNIYREMMYQGARSPYDILPDVQIDETPRPNTIPEPEEVIRVDFTPKSVYEAVKDICDAYDLGFGIMRSTNSGALTFRVYTGYNRTSNQSTNAAVLFSVSLDNLQKTRDIKSSVDFKNVALVLSEQGMLEVFTEDTPTNISGAARRVVVVEADKLDGTPTQTQITAHLTQKGREALAAHRITEAFDGEVSQHSPYEYGVDYGLGDLVEYQNKDGGASIMMVTEQVFALDNQGLRSYPTLTLHVYVQPGSWQSWDQNKEWSALTTEQWNTMP